MTTELHDNATESGEASAASMSNAGESPPMSRRTLLMLIGVVVTTATLYAPTACYDFTNYDEPTVLLDRERVRSLSNLPAIWTRPEQMDFFPITEMSYTIEYAMVAYEPMLYHITNIILHVACTGAVFGLAWSLGLGGLGSAATAALFGLHPIHAESAAWIADRKDLFAGLFSTLSVLCFVGHHRRQRAGLYVLALLLGVAAILSKPSAVSLGACVFVVQVVLLKAGVRRALLRSLPLLIIGLLFSGLIFWMHQAGDNVRPQTFAQPRQWLLAVYGFAFPLWKFVWPYPLLPYYEVGALTLDQRAVWGALATLVGLGGVAWWYRRDVWLILAMGWYVVGIAPVLRFVEVGSMSVADRYMYFPSIGLCLLIGAGVERWRSRSGHSGLRWPVNIGGVSVLIGMVALTHFQIQAWQNSETVWGQVFKHNPQSSKAANGLGEAARAQGQRFNEAGDPQRAASKFVESLPMFTEAIKLDPQYLDAYYNRGLARIDLGQPDEALADFSEVVRIQPTYADAYFQRGNAYEQIGQLDRAEQDFTQAVQLNPTHAMSYNNRGKIRAQQQQYDLAFSDFSKAIESDPGLSNAFANRGNLWLKQKQGEKAFADFERAIQLDDGNVIAYYNRAVAYYTFRKYDMAWKDLKTVQRLGGEINPKFLAALRSKMPEPTR